jgi:hypothetical protein
MIGMSAFVSGYAWYLIAAIISLAWLFMLAGEIREVYAYKRVKLK